ncbi:MAG: DUF1203 domain-containing protein [Pyrinomonadaceae bacterium]
MTYRVVSIPEKISRTARETLTSPQYKGMKADVSVATGYGPCRSCLKVFKQGEDERIYITYNSFDGISDLPGPGPIFIHKRECERYSDDRFPSDLLTLPLLLEAFGDESKLISREKINCEIVDSQIDKAFTDADVRFINLRNGEAGCFVARIERET